MAKEKKVSMQQLMEEGLPPAEGAVMAPEQPTEDELKPMEGEPLWQNGPTQELVDEWKAQYGEIYQSPFGDDIYVWRCMTRDEYKSVLRIQVPRGDTMFREEKICEICVLWPRGYKVQIMGKEKAGIPTLLAEQIMDKSGFTPTREPERL